MKTPVFYRFQISIFVTELKFQAQIKMKLFSILAFLFFTQLQCQQKLFSLFSDSVLLKKQAEMVVKEFSTAIEKIYPKTKVLVPVKVDTTPYLIFINKEGIHLPLWEQVIPDQKTFFYDLAGGETQGENLFGLLFNGFYIIHEMGHSVEASHKIKFKNNYDSEYFANQVAILWWRENGKAQELKQIYEQLNLIIPKLKNPVPEGQTIEQYFTENYEKAAADPYVYGYMQFKQFKEIYEDKKLKTLKDLLKSK